MELGETQTAYHYVCMMHTHTAIHHIPHNMLYTIHHMRITTPYTISHTPYTMYHVPYTIHHTPYHTSYTKYNVYQCAYICYYVFRYHAHDKAIVSMHFLPNEPILITSGADNSIKVLSIWVHTLSLVGPRMCVYVYVQHVFTYSFLFLSIVSAYCMHMCMYVCMYMCMYMSVYVYAYVHAYFCVCACVLACVFVCVMYAYTRIFVYSTHILIYSYSYIVYSYTHLLIYSYTHILIYIYIYINNCQTWIFDKSDSSARLLRSRSGHSSALTRIRFYGGYAHGTGSGSTGSLGMYYRSMSVVMVCIFTLLDTHTTPYHTILYHTISFNTNTILYDTILCP